MDKTAKASDPKGKTYCNKPGTSCFYGPDNVCVNCGRPKGWRVHRIHRDSSYKLCPGKRS